jgi:hypothetical protein
MRRVSNSRKNRRSGLGGKERKEKKEKGRDKDQEE